MSAGADGAAGAGTDRRSGPTRVRSVVAAVLGILAVLLLVVSVVGVWARATVLRRETVSGLVGDAIAEADVQTALAQYLAELVAEGVDLDAVLADALPDALDRFGPALAAGTNAAVERSLTRVLGDEDVQRIITVVVERGHDRAMRLLEGDGLVDGFTVTDGEVSVNLLPLVARGLGALQSTGLLSGVEVPLLAADGDPDAQTQQLSAALGRELPPGFGQLVVYRSDSVADAQAAVQTAQRLLALAERAVWVLVVATVVLMAAAVVVSPRRWRAVLVLGLGVAVAMVLLRSASRQVVDGSADLVVRPGARAALSAIVGGATTTLLRVAGIVLLVAVASVVVAVLCRRSWSADLVLTAAVVAGAATVAILGLSAWAIVAALAVGVAVGIGGRRFESPAPIAVAV